jgi:hypothetical protein
MDQTGSQQKETRERLEAQTLLRRGGVEPLEVEKAFSTLQECQSLMYRSANSLLESLEREKREIAKRRLELERERQEWERAHQKLELTQFGGEQLVRLNVGGERFLMPLPVLLQFSDPPSYFSVMFSGRWNLRRFNVDQQQEQQEQEQQDPTLALAEKQCLSNQQKATTAKEDPPPIEYYIDRDPALFTHIARLLRQSLRIHDAQNAVVAVGLLKKIIERECGELSNEELRLMVDELDFFQLEPLRRQAELVLSERCTIDKDTRLVMDQSKCYDVELPKLMKPDIVSSQNNNSFSTTQVNTGPQGNAAGSSTTQGNSCPRCNPRDGNGSHLCSVCTVMEHQRCLLVRVNTWE